MKTKLQIKTFISIFPFLMEVYLGTSITGSDRKCVSVCFPDDEAVVLKMLDMPEPA